MSRLLLASQRVSSEKIESEGFVFEYKNVHRALSDILS
jgi:NAD dependent epimerase/dehydratase family enzyme